MQGTIRLTFPDVCTMHSGSCTESHESGLQCTLITLAFTCGNATLALDFSSPEVLAEYIKAMNSCLKRERAKQRAMKLRVKGSARE